MIFQEVVGHCSDGRDPEHRTSPNLGLICSILYLIIQSGSITHFVSEWILIWGVYKYVMCFFLWVTWYVATFFGGGSITKYSQLSILLALVHIQSQMRGWRFLDVARLCRSNNWVWSNTVENRLLRAWFFGCSCSCRYNRWDYHRPCVTPKIYSYQRYDIPFLVSFVVWIYLRFTSREMIFAERENHRFPHRFPIVFPCFQWISP